MLNKGVDVKIVSELLGHSNVSVTYNVYIHVIQAQKIKAINMVDIL
jgi:site-specific recombinase XerD